MSPVEIQHVKIDRTDLRYLEFGTPGKDKPPLIMAVGVSASAASLQSIAENVGGHVVIFEAPKRGGHDGRPSLPWYARVTAEAAQEVTGKNTFNVAGHSWGGLLVQEWAIQNEAQVERMALLASTPIRPHTSPRDFILAIPNRRMLKARFALMNHDRDTFDSGAAYGGDVQDNPELLKQYDQLINRVIDKKSHRDQIEAAAIGIVPLGAKNWLQRVRKGGGPPALVVIGRRDNIIPHDYTDRQARELGMVVYSVNDGHLLPITRAIEVADVLKDFYGTPLNKLSKNWRPRNENSPA